MIGISASAETPHPVALLEFCVGGGVKAFARKLRKVPEMPSESGSALVPILPGVAIPFHESMLKRIPALASGTPESLCAGRTAEAARSTLNEFEAWILRETRSCMLREKSWLGSPRNCTVQGE